MKINSERTTATQCSLSAGHQTLHSIETMRVETHHSTPKSGENNLDNPGEEEYDPERGKVYPVHPHKEKQDANNDKMHQKLR